MKIQRRILLLLLIPVSGFAQFDGDEQVWKGVKAFYNYQSKESVQILEKARKDYPEHPAVHMTWAAARYLENQANSSIEKTYEVLVQDLDEVKEIYEELHVKFPDIPEYELFLGSAIGFKARVYLGRKEWIKTLVYAYQGFIIVRNLEKDHPELIDNFLPVGLVEYFAGISGSLVQYATNILGFTPTKESGLARIQNAADNGPYSWIEASSILAFISLWVEEDFGTALQYSEKLVNHFPDNYYFRIIRLESRIKLYPQSDHEDEILDMRKRLSSLTPTQISWYTSFLLYQEALIAYNNDEYNLSLGLLEKAIENYNAELDMILGECYYLKGKCQEKMRNVESAKQAYRKCVKLKNHTAVIKKAEIAHERLDLIKYSL